MATPVTRLGSSALDDRLAAARLIAVLLPTALIAGALTSQYVGGLYPCEMCHWQRWPHYAAIAIALLSFAAPRPGVRPLVLLAALAVAISGAIGVFHAGVEYHWWQGITACSSTIRGSGGSAADMLSRIMKAPVVRCDVAQWRFAGISLAGYNALCSLGGAAAILWLARRA